MRALFLLTLMVVLVPLAFLAPFTGLLTFVWLAYTRLHVLAYSATASYSLAVASATLLGYLVFELTRRPPKLRPNLWLILLWAQLLLSTALAYSPAEALPKFVEFSKIILIALLIATLADSENRVRWLLLVMLVSIGFISLRANVGLVRYGLTMSIQGPMGGFADNNDFALLLNMALPIMIYFGRSEPKWWLRWGFYGLALMPVVTVLFSRSRGGFLGLCAVAVGLGLKTKYKLTGLAAVALLGALSLAVLPGDILERLSTIRTAHAEDQSAIGRINAWKVCLQIIREHPLAGVGLRNIMDVYTKYDDTTTARVAHNSYLQMAVDAGLPALFLFVGIIGLSYGRLRKARRILKTRAPASRLINYTHGLEVALIGYVVSATFLSQHYMELLYHVVGLTTSIMLIARSYEREVEMRELVAAAAHSFAADPVAAAR